MHSEVRVLLPQPEVFVRLHGDSACNLGRYRECGVMVAYDIWDVVEQFESDTFYQLNTRACRNGRRLWPRTRWQRRAGSSPVARTTTYGGVLKWLKSAVLKIARRLIAVRGFESYLRRHPHTPSFGHQNKNLKVSEIFGIIYIQNEKGKNKWVGSKMSRINCPGNAKPKKN